MALCRIRKPVPRLLVADDVGQRRLRYNYLKWRRNATQSMSVVRKTSALVSLSLRDGQWMKHLKTLLWKRMRSRRMTRHAIHRSQGTPSSPGLTDLDVALPGICFVPLVPTSIALVSSRMSEFMCFCRRPPTLYNMTDSFTASERWQPRDNSPFSFLIPIKQVLSRTRHRR